MIRGELAAAELRVRLGALLRGVAAALDRRAERTAALARPQIDRVAITEQHARAALHEAEVFALNGRAYGPGASAGEPELALLEHIRRQARDAGVVLPGDVLRGRSLGDLDIELLVMAAAPSIDPAFATAYAFINDVVSCGALTPQLAIEALATNGDHERRIVEGCGPFGVLRSDGWLRACDGARAPSLTPLLPADGVTELLCGSAVDGALLARRGPRRDAGALPAGVDPEAIVALAEAFGAGRVDVLGVWGSDGAGGRAVAAALLAGRPAVHAGSDDPLGALQRAAIGGCACVIDLPADEDAAQAIVATIAAASVPVVLRGEDPLRTPELIAGRRFAEIEIPSPGFADRRATWSSAFPQLDDRGVDDLAARFRLLPAEVAAVAAMDRAAAAWSHNGDRPTLDRLAGLISRRRSASVATIRTPRRTRDMLVLPDAELAQVLEVRGRRARVAADRRGVAAGAVRQSGCHRAVRRRPGHGQDARR